MSLIINQGKQDTSSDNTFEVMLSEQEIAQIIKLELDKEWENTLNITFKVLSDGKYKGRQFWDRVSFDPKGKFSWKYRNLRKAAGVPYAESENPSIDIEALLLNKAVTVKLSARKGTDGNEYQAVTYKTTTVKAEENTEAVKTPAAVLPGDDLPFDEVTVVDEPTTDTDVEW